MLVPLRAMRPGIVYVPGGSDVTHMLAVELRRQACGNGAPDDLAENEKPTIFRVIRTAISKFADGRRPDCPEG
jgi:hypothetical protein